MKFSGEKCLVCQKTFTDEDDVVVCPECGTPHHRECWHINGCCVNAALHETGYEYKISLNPDNGSEVDTDGSASAETENPFFGDANVPFNSELFNGEEINQEGAEKITVGGSDIRYYIAALGKNCSYYLNRFLILDGRKKIPLFNTMAFLFPFAWSVYRKMFKSAAVIFALYFGLMTLISLPVITNKDLVNGFNEVIAENPENIAESISKISMYMTSNDSVQLTEKQTNFVNIYIETQTKTSVAYTVFVYLYSFALHAASGLLSTSLYYKKIKKRVQTVEQNDSLTFREKIAVLTSKNPTIPFFIAAVIGFLEFGLIQI